MSKPLEDLVELLALERIEENLFRGQSRDLGWGTVFGGQVLGQALSAAEQTVPAERHVHSLNAYFLRPGNVSHPIVYDVDRIRDGGSFNTRRVVAIQRGEPIFNLAASFQKLEEGYDHQDPMPEVPPPESLPTDQERAALSTELPARVREVAMAPGPFESRAIDVLDSAIRPTPRAPIRRVWVRATGTLPDRPTLHRSLLAYASDRSFLTTALFPHGAAWLTPGLQLASLDHVMWFHRPFRIDDWLLYVMESSTAQGSRGLTHGRFFSRDGHLVASTAQEGLMRVRTKTPTS
ncbi:acyl-CoA thioesterase II [Pendulispora rubella]|uniref:Acyl-CoA thioesterase II n=1 Tax=Pendulispora rubella TaxID=2741070 RepID=A0ABZ2L4L7_9BACT